MYEISRTPTPTLAHASMPKSSPAYPLHSYRCLASNANSAGVLVSEASLSEYSRPYSSLWKPKFVSQALRGAKCAVKQEKKRAGLTDTYYNDLESVFGGPFRKSIARTYGKPPLEISAGELRARLLLIDKKRRHKRTRNMDWAERSLKEILSEPIKQFPDQKSLNQFLTKNTIAELTECILYAFYADDRTYTKLSKEQVNTLVRQRLTEQLKRLSKITNSLLPNTAQSPAFHKITTLDTISFIINESASRLLTPPSCKRPSELFDETIAHCRQGKKLLQNFPTTPHDLRQLEAEIESFKETSQYICKQLDQEIASIDRHFQKPETQTSKDLSNLKGFMIFLKSDLISMQDKVESHVENATTFLIQHPLSGSAIKNSINRWCNAARALIPVMNSNALAQIETIRVDTLEKIKPISAPKEAAATLQTLRKHLVNELNSQHKSPDTQQALEDAHNDMLNVESWVPFDATYSLDINDYFATYKSRMTPAAMHPALSGIYKDDKINGLCCGAKDRNYHPANVWITTLLDTSTNDSNESVLFSGLRHATLSTETLSDSFLNNQHSRNTLISKFSLLPNASNEDIRQAIARHRIKEILTLGIEAVSSLKSEAIEHRKVAVNIVTINLQTSVDLAGSRKIPRNDKIYIENQAKMLKDLEDKTIKISLGDGDKNKGREDCFDETIEVTIKKVNTGNVPVNPGRGFGDITARAMNTETVVGLLGSLHSDDPISGTVKEFLDAHPDIDPHRRDIILQLASQVRNIMSRKNESIYNNGKSGEDDIYQLPARIALLAFLTDSIVLFNCMSGKDRTGHLNAEIEFLAERIIAEGRVPAPGPLTENKGKKDTPLSDAFSIVALRGGHLTIQYLNTGSKGYKTKNVPAVRHRISRKYRDTYAGAADAVDH